MPKLFDESALIKLISHESIKPVIYDELVSTNTIAKQMAANGSQEGLLIIAEHQTGGRGRLGRSFYSPSGTGIYFSLILRPELLPDETVLITSAAAVAVAEAIEKMTKKNVAIKWVNDIFLNKKKVCGILSEATFKADGSGMEHIVLGIGINISPPKKGFPPELKNIAGALKSNIEPCFAENLLAEVINRFMYYYTNLTSRVFLPAYRNRLMLKNKTITFTKNGMTQFGTVLDVDDNFRLKVKLPNDNIVFLSSGEVSLGSEQLVDN